MWLQELIPAIQSDFVHGDYQFNYYFDLVVQGRHVNGGCADWLNSRLDEVIMGMGGKLIGLDFVTANDTDVFDQENATYNLFSCENTTFRPPKPAPRAAKTPRNRARTAFGERKVVLEHAK